MPNTTRKIETPRQAILRAAVEKYGPGAQQMKAIEELGELIRALARADDPDNIAEEMADVEIMLGQLRIILGNDADVERWKVKKLQRLSITENLPAVDAVPVVHGRWNVILNPFWDAECSECGYAKKTGWEWGFCPNCGAKMDGERRDES